MSELNFTIEQIALYPEDPEAAIELLRDMGAESWIKDRVEASGIVFGNEAQNTGQLNFNYQLSPSGQNPQELEVLHYERGRNWMEDNDSHDPMPRVSHLGMHCTGDELAQWRQFFSARGIKVAQEVITDSHENPAIAGVRRYQYTIFDTYPILGVDLKFIVRLADHRSEES